MSRFKKGAGKPPGSGRKKGTPNKKTLLKAEELLANADIHPLQLLLNLIPKLDPAEAARTLLEIYKFIQPQLKHFDTSNKAIPPPPQDELEEDTDSLLKIVDGSKSSNNRQG